MLNLDNLKPNVATAIILVTVNIFTAALSIFLLNRPLFFSLNLFQMVGVCIGLSVPIFFGCSFISEWFTLSPTFSKEPKAAKDAAEMWTNAGGVTLIAFNFALFIGYCNGASLKAFYFFLAVSITIAVGLGVIELMMRTKKESKPSTNQPEK